MKYINYYSLLCPYLLHATIKPFLSEIWLNTETGKMAHSDMTVMLCWFPHLNPLYIKAERRTKNIIIMHFDSKWVWSVSKPFICRPIICLFI